MSSATTELVILSDDDDTHDMLAKAFEARFPKSALAAYGRVLKANDVTAGMLAERSRKIADVQARKRDRLHHINAIDRDLAHGDQHSPAEMEKYAASKAMVERCNAEAYRLQHTPVTSSLPAETLAEWIGDNPGEFVDATVTVTLAKGQTPLEAVEASRGRLGALTKEKAAVRRELVPFSQAVNRLREDVRQNQLPPDLSRIVKLHAPLQEFVTKTEIRRPEAQGHVGWPSREEVGEGGRRIELDEAARLICWLFGDEIVKRCTVELEKIYAGRKGMSVEERTRRIAEIDAEILAEQRKEEGFLRMAEDAGQTVFRQPRANPLAVLGIAPKKA